MIALARRYRPKRFADLLVQDHVAAVLRGAVARGRVGHGYLLTGPRGVGKTTAARILAMALNCPNRDASGEPCGECENCHRVWSGVREPRRRRDRRGQQPRRGRRARPARARDVCRLPGGALQGLHRGRSAHAHPRGVERAAQDPRGAAAAAWCSSSPPPSRRRSRPPRRPVLSRLQRFDFRRIGPAAIRDRLRQVLAAEGIAADEDALRLIARHADGGMRDALSVLDQCLSFGEGAVTADRVREVLGLVDDEVYAELLELVAERRPAGVFPLVERLVDAGADLVEFMGGAGEALRALLMLQLGGEPEGLTEALRGGARGLSGPARSRATCSGC